MPRDTLLDFFHDFAGLEDEFLIYDDGFHARHYRYREIAARARAFAARLREQGSARDDKVILYGENRPEWIIALWGCLLEGVIAVPIDYRSSPEFVERIKSHCRRAHGSDRRRSRHVRWPGAAPSRQRITKDQTAEIIFTSGATAEPKGVIITHRNILANIVPVENEVKKYLRYAVRSLPSDFSICCR